MSPKAIVKCLSFTVPLATCEVFCPLHEVKTVNPLKIEVCLISLSVCLMFAGSVRVAANV